MSKSNEAFWWSLFSAGGVLAALCMPVFVLITGFLIPKLVGGKEDPALVFYDMFSSMASKWPVRITLFAVIFFSLFHCAHRIRHTLMDLGLRHSTGLLAAICYLSALTWSVFAVLALIRL